MRERSSSHHCAILLLGALASLPMSGLALTPFPEDGLWGYVDSQGAFVIEPQYARASAFNAEGFAIVEVSRPEGKGYWLSRSRLSPESLHSYPGPARDAAHQQKEGLELAFWWQHDYAMGPVDLFSFLGFHGDSSAMGAFLKQPHHSPEVFSDQFLLSFEVGSNDLDLSDEVNYRLVSRDGEIIHEFRQKNWVQPKAPMGHTLHYEEMRESLEEPIAIVLLDLRTTEPKKMPLEAGMKGQSFGDHIIIANPTVQFLQYAIAAGEILEAGMELPQSSVVNSYGETLFQSSGYASTFPNSDSVFSLMQDGRSHFARLPDGIFAGPYERCLGFTDQRGLVLLDEDTFSYVDEEGAMLSEDGFAYATLFHDGHAVIRRHGSPRWEVITPDLATQAVIEGVGEVLRPTVGAIPFRRGEKWGYLNLDGTEKIPAQFDAVGDFENRVALALNETTFILINEAGERLREGTLPSYVIPEPLSIFGPDPFESRHDPNEPFGRDPFREAPTE